VEVKKNLVRRSIEQLGFIKDVNSLVVLSGVKAPALFIPHTSLTLGERGDSYLISTAIFFPPNTTGEGESRIFVFNLFLGA